MLTREEILGIVDIKIERVEVPEWGGEVYIRSLSGEDFVLMKALLGGGGVDEDVDSMEKTIILCVCDKEGNRLFKEEDLPLIKKKSFNALNRLTGVILSANNLAVEDQEEIEKKYSTTLG